MLGHVIQAWLKTWRNSDVNDQDRKVKNGAKGSQQQTEGDWVSSGSLQDCTRFMFEKQLACDCTILVGQQEFATKVSAHRFILIARSPVFRAMLCGPMSENVGSDLNAEDCDPVSFREVLRFMYCEEADIDNQNAFGVLYAAKKYMLWDLAKRCLDFLSKALNEENVCDLLTLSDYFQETALYLSCQNFVKKHAATVIKTQGFLEVPQYILEQIISYDPLAASEQEVFCALVDWSEKQCSNSGTEATPKDKRLMIGDKAFSQLRLTSFTRTFFYKEVLSSGLLNPDEEKTLCDFYEGRSINPVLPWLVQGQRRDPSDKHHCLLSTSCTHSTKLAGNWYKTMLEATQDLCITRVDVFDRCKPSSTVHVSIVVMQNGEVVARASSRTSHVRVEKDRYSVIPIYLADWKPVHKGRFEINVCYRFLGGMYGATPSALAPKGDMGCPCGCASFKLEPDTSIYISSFEFSFPF